ncbi:hypothetical protein N7468_007814 [Penicillium chermesinum]|uniref:Phosphoglycerate mutase-like protein n=1 Tax=Penicillium chermesinum TaxID=63820 RepID=A0A9W9NNM6_9EURO|nr:uncharacterized protein N7468_007814 [Penicillium chermesinum]KAJ5223272.1 hypothetical protein N7468_007814 [Penicillium chermesinum]
MRSSIQSGLLLATLVAPVVSAERILGNTQLTDLGYREVFDAGSFYHNRYVDSDSDKHIERLNDTYAIAKQINASAPADAVLQNSATGFLQGVYPPRGYQLIQLSSVASGKNSEDSSWLQGSSGCNKATLSSDAYYASDSYNDLLKSTQGFYQSLTPMLNSTFSSSDISFKNAYTIFDYLNVGYIHNSSAEFPHEADYTAEVRQQLISLAGTHEFNLAYNESDPVRAIDGAVWIGQMLSSFNEIIESKGTKSMLNVQFGSYGTFMSFWGLTQMPAASVNFTGIPDYASSMSLELVTNATGTDFPSEDEISVRFMFHNGTMTGSDEPTVFPMFGQSETVLPWSDFSSQASKVGVTSNGQWCAMCGNTDGKCASFASSSGSGSASASHTAGSGGMSRAVAGVIGAMVTLAVVLGLEALFFLVGGFRIAKRNKGGPGMGAAAEVADDKSLN